MSEDSAQACFAGEFETVLDVHTDDKGRNQRRAAARCWIVDRIGKSGIIPQAAARRLTDLKQA